VPAVLEAVDRYVKFPAARLLELSFRRAGMIGRGPHLVKQIAITIALCRIFREWSYDCDTAILGEIWHTYLRLACLQACLQSGGDGTGHCHVVSSRRPNLLKTQAVYYA
jgi:hypothetical protein